MQRTARSQLPLKTGLTLAGLLRLVTLLLGLVGVVTFISVNSRHLTEPIATQISATVDTGLNAEMAHERLLQAPIDRAMAGDRSSRPYWILARRLGEREPEHDRLIIGNKSLRTVAVQLRDDQGGIVKEFYADRSTSGSRLQPFHGGFTLDLADLKFDEALFKVRSVGATRFTVSLQSAAEFGASIDASERLAAMLAGAMLALAAFTAVIATFTYSTPLAAAAFWIVSLLGVTCITLGYDLMWLEYKVSAIIELRFKQTILALFMVSSCLLFYSIFRRELAHIGSFLSVQRLTKCISVGVPLMALSLPTNVFLPVFWSLSLIVLAYHATVTMKIARQHTSVTVSIFGWSWGAISICIVAEILYAVGLVARIPGLSFEAGAIVGAFFAASAAASSFRIERIRRKKATARSRQIAQQYREIYNQVPTGLLSVGSDGVITSANPTARTMLGQAALEGIQVAQALGPHGPTLTTDMVLQENPVEVQVNGLTLSLKSIATQNGIEVTMSDVSAMAELHATLQHQATHDYVTGALSPQGLEQHLQGIENCDRAVLHLELTNLGMLTKLHGKAVSDFALQQFYERVCQEAGTDRVIARIGNGDFVVLWKTDDTTEPLTEARRLSSELTATPYQHEYISLRFELSGGLAHAGVDVSVTEALAHAQRASQETHATASEDITVFDPSGPLNQRLNEERYWDDFVQSDRRFKRLELWAQPIVPLQENDRHCSLEVLLRVRNRFGEIQAPGGFLDAAYRHSLMPSVDYFVVKSALEFFTNNPDLGKKIGYVSVNLSSVSVNSAQFLSELTILISRYPVAAGLLCLEITESVALTDLQSVRNFTSEMNSLGIKLALDDFGSGYTSFSYVKSLPAKILKLDGSFVSDIVTSAESRSIVTSVVALGHGLGMTCVAEWVTSAAAATILREIGCDYAQGFHYCAAKPLESWGTILSIESETLGEVLTPVTDDLPAPETLPSTVDSV